MKAPGNPNRHPSVILPHEHVDVQHFIDVSTLTPEKLNEIYALYSYLVDLHISQIRPNLKEKSYIPSKFNSMQFYDSVERNLDLDNKFFEFYHEFKESN